MTQVKPYRDADHCSPRSLTRKRRFLGGTRMFTEHGHGPQHLTGEDMVGESLSLNRGSNFSFHMLFCTHGKYIFVITHNCYLKLLGK